MKYKLSLRAYIFNVRVDVGLLRCLVFTTVCIHVSFRHLSGLQLRIAAEILAAEN